MRRITTQLGWMAFLCAALPAFSAPQEITLTRKVQPDTTMRFHATSVINAAGAEVQVMRSYKVVSHSVKPTGEAELEEVTENGQVTIMGQTMDLPAAAGPVTTTVDRLGKVLQFTAPELGFTTRAVAQISVELESPLFPDKAVAAGAEWTTEYDNPSVNGKKILVKTTYTGMEKLDGRDLVKLKQTGAADVEGGKTVKASGEFWLDPINGAIVKYTLAVKGLPTQYGDLDLNTTVTAVPDKTDK